ncbi:hypothetical protein DQW50_04160 [Halorubrum sp. 48-1-W]|uniref:hypothetical protein n=1 Tax=Halorubrum sp. 48-1-W TaxID=2249761 RepID=UPI000DCD0B69|nr:hypothetical protein [Halorubrum sp. 48-1-W]RAW46432.1 hypothetical protein DQW50_04160 [Halorubrum sp. 48-1-W]
MLSTVVTGILILGAVGSVLAGGIYFYWQLADRRLTDIDDRQRWFKENYEGDHIHGNMLNATIGSIRCYPPQSLGGIVKRYLLRDIGRTEVTLLFERTKIEDEVWDSLKDFVEEDGVKVQSYDYTQANRSSFVTIEIPSFDSEEVELAASRAVMMIDTFFEQQKAGNI